MTFLDRITDYIISMALTIVVIVIFVQEPFVKLILSHKELKNQIIELNDKNLELSKELQVLKNGLDNIDDPERISISLLINNNKEHIEENNKAIKSNYELISDLNGFLENDNEKMKSFYEINANYKSISARLQKNEEKIEKIDDRIYSSFASKENIMFGFLLLLIPICIKLWISNRKLKHDLAAGKPII